MNTRSSHSIKYPHLPRPHGRTLDLGARHIVWVWLTLVLVLVASACGPATPSSPPMALPISYIAADDFAPPDPRWARFDTEASAVYALAGELYLEDRGQGTSVYTPLIGEKHVDIDVTVDVRHVQGSVNNWIGVLCRQQDEQNYYLLAISADGYYLILEAVDGETTPLVGPEYSEEIRSGKAENHLRALCKGTSLSLWVNGELLTVTSDRTLQEAGNVALFADAVERGEIVVVAFDNFVLAEP